MAFDDAFFDPAFFDTELSVEAGPFIVELRPQSAAPILPFGATFAGELADPSHQVFITAVFHFPAAGGGYPGGDIHVSEYAPLGSRTITIGGQTYYAVIANVGTIASEIQLNGEPQTTFAGLEMDFVNSAALPGTTRLSDYFRPLGNVSVDVYYTVKTAGGAYYQEKAFPGVVLGGPRWGYGKATIRIESLMYKKLSAKVLRTFSLDDFPYGREADAGKPLQFVLGRVPAVPTLLIKQNLVSIPEPGANNLGDCVMGRPVALYGAHFDPALTSSTDYVVTFTSQTTFDVATTTPTDKGSGNVFEDFFSEENAGRPSQLKIPSSVWSGVPQAGDTFTFTIDRDPQDPAGVPATGNYETAPTGSVIFVGESPSGEGEVQEIRAVRWNGYVLSGESISSGTGDQSSDLPMAPFREPAFVSNEVLYQGQRRSFDPGFSTYEEDLDTSSFDASGKPVFWIPFRSLEDLRLTQSGFHALTSGDDDSLNLTVWDETRTKIVDSAIVGRNAASATRPFSASHDVPMPSGTRYYARLQLEPGSTLGVGANPTPGYGVTWEGKIGGTTYTDQPLSSFPGIGGPWNGVRFYLGGQGDNAEAGASDTYYALVRIKTARLLDSITLPIRRYGDATPDKPVDIEFLRAFGPDPRDGELVASATITGDQGNEASDVVGSESGRVTAHWDQAEEAAVFVTPGHYWLKITAERTVTADGQTGGWMLRSYGVRNIELTEPYRFSSARLGFNLTPRPMVFDDGTQAEIEYVLNCASIRRETSIDDGTGHDVALVKLGSPIPDGVEITVDVEGSVPFGASQGGCRPDRVFRFFSNRAGIADASIDLAGSFADAASHYDSAPLYRFDGVVNGPGTYLELFAKLGFECRSILDWSIDRLNLLWIPDSGADVSIDDTLTFADIMISDENDPLVFLDRAEAEDVVNVVNLQWLRRWADDSYQRTVERRDEDSITAFEAELAKDELFRMDFVRRLAMAEDLADFFIARLSGRPIVGTVVTKTHKLGTRKIDTLALDIDDMQGITTSTKLLVEGVAPVWGPRQVELTVRELA